MPKRIPDLAETILEQATQSFAALGYSGTEMKAVAQAAGTSVGNLYNYFPSKPSLFLAVYNRWRDLSVEAMDEIVSGAGSPRDRLWRSIKRLYDDVVQFQGLWAEFMAAFHKERLPARPEAAGLGAAGGGPIARGGTAAGGGTGAGATAAGAPGSAGPGADWWEQFADMRSLRPEESRLLAKMQQVLVELHPGGQAPVWIAAGGHRGALSLMMTTIQMAMHFPEEREENERFLKDFLESLLGDGPKESL